jgi:CO dehydrogenase/acetyl-CoA synthase beta subunit
MGLFDEPLAEIVSWREERRAEGQLREFPHDPAAAWPEQVSLVLKDDTALELGATGRASLSLLLWTEREGLLREDSVCLIGPDLPQESADAVPFAQLVLVRGGFPDEYDAYRDLRDVVYDTRAAGISTRIWPDRSQIWCRVSRQAMRDGFTLVKYGNSLLGRLRETEAVRGAEIVFITGDQASLDRLRPAAEKAQDTVEALIKMYEEMNFDCETCEYVEVCEEVVELKQIRERLKEERGAS